MMQYAGIDNNNTTINAKLYNVMYGLSKKVEQGWIGNVEMMSYLIFLVIFVVILVNNNTVYLDTSGNIVQPSPAINTNNTIFQVLCGAGILLCLIRIVWSASFLAQKTYNRSVELIFSSLIWILFIAALVMSLMTQSQLNAAAALAANTPNQGAVGAVAASSISQALQQNQSEWILASVGIAISTLYTVYNVYNIMQPIEVIPDAPSS